ncbi:MAG TPA: insulinase family protein [Chitinophagales bacterium]|nr:insulinase family protein [Chitinophagales bacterium]
MIHLRKLSVLSLTAAVVFTFFSSQNVAEACGKNKKKKNNTEQVLTPVESSKSTVKKENAETEDPAIAAARQQALPLDPNVKQGTLPNGLQYFIRKNSKPENRMEMRLIVNAGSNQEDDDQKGLAHFLEHMAFNGSKNFEKNDLVNYVESIGVKFGPHLNAYTSFDETVYMLQVPTDKPEILEKGLLILEDWATGLTLATEEIDKERGVVVSEWRSSLGPQQRMQYEFFPVLLKNSRYPERLPIGDTAIINNAAPIVVKRFYTDWYRPDLMAVVLVGDFDVAEMEKEIIERFSTIPTVPNARKKETYEVPPHQETLVSIVTDKEAPYTQAMIFEKHPVSSNNNVIGFRDMVKQMIINNVINERLREILQQPQPPFFIAQSSYENQLRTLDAFAAVAIGTAENTEEMLKVLYEEIYRVERFGVTKAEFDRAVIEIQNGYETALKEKDKTESANYASEYVKYYLENVAAPGIEIENQLIQVLLPTISAQEINATIKQLITHKNTVVIITAPEKDAANLPTKAEILEIEKSVAASDLKAVEEKVVETNLLPNAPVAGKIIEKTKDEKNDVEKWTLSNGATVYIKPTDFKNDEILIQAISPGGSSLYGLEDIYSISNAAALVTESGFGEFDKSSLNKALAGKNVSSTPFIKELEEGINASASPKDLETLMQLIHLNFTAPRKDSLTFQSYIAKNKGLYSNLLANPMVYFQKTLLETIFQKNPRRSFPAVEDFDKISFDKAISFYKERFSNAADFNFVIVGNVEDENLAPLVEMYIASLPSTGKKEQFKDPKVEVAKGKVNKEITMGAAPKTNALFFYSGKKNWTKSESTIFNVMSGVLNIKLRENLREDKGGVYGVSVSSDFSRIPTPEYSTLITYNADPSKAAEIEEAAMEVIEDIKKNGVDEATLNKVKETFKREMEVNIKENGYWAGEIIESITFNEPIQDAEKAVKDVQSVTATQVQKAIQEYLKGDNFIRVVMSPEKEEKK